MKTKFTLFAASLLLAVTTMAQTSYNSAIQKFNFGNQTIVRNWDDQYVISHFSENGSSYFLCSDFSDFLNPYSSYCFNSSAFYSDPLPSNYYVTDFRILKDIVFFCGTNQTVSGTVGMVGFFELNDFITGNFYPTIIDIISTCRINKITVYENNGDFKIAAIGQKNQTPTEWNIIEIDDVMAPSPLYVTHSTGSSPSDFERLDDVLYTGNSVVFIGTRVVPSASFYTCFIRIMDNPATFNISTNYNNIFYIPLSSEINAQTYSALMENGKISIAYVKYNIGFPSEFRTRVRVVDLSTPTNPQNTFSQEFDIDGKLDPDGIVYSSSARKLIILQPVSYFYNQYPQFIYIDPYTTSNYITDLSYFLGDSYSSVDIYNNNNFIAVGDVHSYLQYIPTPSNNGCPNGFDANVYNLTNTLFLSDYLHLTDVNIYASPLQFYYGTHLVNWSSECCSQ